MPKQGESKSDRELTGRPRQVAGLTDAQIKAIEENILENASPEWSKVSRIVLTTMIERQEGVTGLPESFYCERVAHLVKDGRLEARGELSDMHAGEVRLVERK